MKLKIIQSTYSFLVIHKLIIAVSIDALPHHLNCMRVLDMKTHKAVAVYILIAYFSVVAILSVVILGAY